MKKIMLITVLLISISTFAQTKTLNSVGGGLSYSPGSTLTNSTALTTVYADTLAPNVFAVGRKYEFVLYCSLTTPLSLLPSITITVNINGQSLTLVSSGLLGTSLTKKPFVIKVSSFAQSSAQEFLYAELLGDNGAMLVGSNYYSKSGVMTVDLTSQVIFKVTAQFSAATGLSSTSLYVDNIYKEPF